jgi:hypothetical protein
VLLAVVRLLAVPALAGAQSTGGVKGALFTRGLALNPDGSGLLGVHAQPRRRTARDRRKR